MPRYSFSKENKYMKCMDEKVTLKFKDGRLLSTYSKHRKLFRDAEVIERVKCTGSITLNIIQKPFEDYYACERCAEEKKYIDVEWYCTEQHISNSGIFQSIDSITSFINSNIETITGIIEMEKTESLNKN